jgi:drug/metabolite transporter (DMT)-like permease
LLRPTGCGFKTFVGRALILTTTVFLLVLLAALLHAGWNVLIKFNLDKFLSLFLLQVFMGLFGLIMLGFTGLPKETAWGYALVSGLVHTAYNLFLIRSYKTADLSVVYPLARGGAPLLTLLGALVFAGDYPVGLALLGTLCLLAGLMVVGLSGLRKAAIDKATLMFAGGTALFISIYTLIDGLGARVSGDAIAYSGLIFFLDGLFFLITGVAFRGVGIFKQVAPFAVQGAFSSAASCLAYGLVIWAMTMAPIAAVAALRETSIVFALILSARFLKETLTIARVIGAVLIACGAILLRMA